MHRTLFLLGTAALTLTACGPSGSGQGSGRDAIRIVGSSTVYPMSTAVSEQFVRKNPGFKPPIVESTGTGGGMKLFCAGIGAQHPDIEDASRRIKKSELEDCAKNGVKDIVEIQIGIDGIILAESREGSAIKLSPADVYKALAARPYGKEQTAKSWKDVNPALPAIAIRVYGPPPTSGTRDAFSELIMEKGCNADPAMVALKKSNEDEYKSICTGMREDGAFVEAGENDNLIVQKLEANPGTVGIFGYSYLEENANRLKGIAINGVSPSYESISSFKYPGSRPLYIYVKNAHARAIPAIKAYVAEFAKETAWGPNGYLVKRGMIAAPDAIRAKSAAAARALTPLDPASVK